MQGRSSWDKGTEEGFIRAGQLAQEIIDMEPESPVGYRLMAWYHYNLANSGQSLRENSEKAFMFAQKTLSIDETDPMAHATLGWVIC